MKTLKRIQEIVSESTDLLIPRGAISIPRHQMPQISSEDYPKFFKHLNFRGISVTRKKIVALNLRAAQNEINKSKVIKWAKVLPQGAKEKPCIISSDFYVLDGNHTWLSQLNKNTCISIDCYQIGLPLMELLDILKSFNDVSYKSVNEEKNLWPIWDSFNSPFQILGRY